MDARYRQYVSRETLKVIFTRRFYRIEVDY